MKNAIALAALALMVSVTPACLGTRAYQPLLVAVRAPSVVRSMAVNEFALDEDLYVLHRSEDQTVIELVSRARATTRSRIRIEYRSDPIAISFWTEVRGHGGVWLRSSVVCDEYSHAREREIARRIKHLIRRQMLL